MKTSTIVLISVGGFLVLGGIVTAVIVVSNNNEKAQEAQIAALTKSSQSGSLTGIIGGIAGLFA